MKTYVLVFAFDAHGRAVLIRKRKPEWQAGRLNGVGGKVEGAETPTEAARREFSEETGVDVELARFDPFCEMRGQAGWTVYCFRVRGAVEGARTIEAEEVELHHPEALHTQGPIPNLLWLVPMAWQNDVDAEVEYR